MPKKYYIDTCIWIDFLEGREDKFRPLGEWAFMLIRKIIGEESIIILSNILRDEMNAYAIEDKIREIVPARLLVRINESLGQVREAAAYSKRTGMPKKDALHAVLARDNNAVLVTRDKHFHMIYSQIEAKKPEELI